MSKPPLTNNPSTAMSEAFDPDRTIVKKSIRGSARVSADATVIADATVLAGQGDMLALPVGTRIGDVEILKLIGVGGSGIVYLAQDHSQDRQVALKEYFPPSIASRRAGLSVSARFEQHAEVLAAGLRSFIDRAQMLAQIDHPSLVKVHRFWEAGGTAFMVMPHYEGPTLAQALLDLGSAPSEAWIEGVLGPLLEAVQLLHQRNYVHRDISPDNIILVNSGQPVLLDSGAARRVIGPMIRTPTLLVRPGFAPIEQYPENKDMLQGAWTDIYAIGALAYFAITGKVPTPSISRVTNDPLVPLAQMANEQYQPRFLHAIDRALQVDPNQRPQSIDEFLGLLGWSDSAHIPIEPEGRVEVAASVMPAKPVKRLPVKTIVGAMVLATALLVAGTVWFTSGGQQGPTVVRTPSSPEAPLPAVTAVPSGTSEAVTPAVRPEPTQAEQAQSGLLPAQTAGESSPPVPVDTATRGTQSDGGSSQVRAAVGSNDAAAPKPPVSPPVRESRPPAPKKPPPAPPPVTAKRPPAPLVEPPAAAPEPAAEIRVAAPVQPPPAVVPAKQAEPVKAPVAVAISPKNACKTALLNWMCMKEMCSKPELQNNKECVEWRTPATSR